MYDFLILVLCGTLIFFAGFVIYGFYELSKLQQQKPNRKGITLRKESNQK